MIDSPTDTSLTKGRERSTPGMSHADTHTSLHGPTGGVPSHKALSDTLRLPPRAELRAADEERTRVQRGSADLLFPLRQPQSRPSTFIVKRSPPLVREIANPSCEQRERLGSADEQRPRGAAHVLDERRANAFIVSQDPPYSSALAVSEASEGHSGDPFWCVRSIGQSSAKGVC
eukprot:scaffold15792_cov141-Isochrysis_galbana.AAC.6